MAPTVGAVVAQGSRSTVRALGADAVAKVPLPNTAEAWIRTPGDRRALCMEARIPGVDAQG